MVGAKHRRSKTPCEIPWRIFRHGAHHPSHPRRLQHPRPRQHLHRQISTILKHNQILITNDKTTFGICSRANFRIIYTHINSSSRNHSHFTSKRWITTTTLTMDSRTMISKVKNHISFHVQLRRRLHKILSINFHFISVNFLSHIFIFCFRQFRFCVSPVIVPSFIWAFFFSFTFLHPAHPKQLLMFYVWRK